MAWVSPTGANGNWSSMANCYDDDTGTASDYDVTSASWSESLGLAGPTLQCDRVQIWSDGEEGDIDQIEVYVYYNSSWNNIYSGALTTGSFQEYVIGSTQAVNTISVRYHNLHSTQNRRAYCYEADFWEVPSGPTPNAYNRIEYTSEPPTPSAWNQVKQDVGSGYRKLEYS